MTVDMITFSGNESGFSCTLLARPTGYVLPVPIIIRETTALAQRGLPEGAITRC